jgi:hypothetical protein
LLFYPTHEAGAVNQDFGADAANVWFEAIL